MIPFVPHLANEALEQINANDIEWPKYDEKLLIEEKINFVIQINGKKRSIIETKRGIKQDQLMAQVFQEENLKKYLNDKEIKRKIFVPDKLINIII